MSRFILASGSPRRKELLEQVGLEFEICPAKGEEVIWGSCPSEVVMSLSRQKAEEVAANILAYNEEHQDIVTPTDIIVLGADTVVAFENEILGKPVDEEEARRVLTMLQGKRHSVFTGVTLVFISADGRTGEKCFFEETKVSMYPMSELEIDRYIASGEPMDKAGSYGIQGKCAIHIKGIDGDYNNVVGLPVARIFEELKVLGIDPYLW